MLVNPEFGVQPTFALALLVGMHGDEGSVMPRKLDDGIFLANHWNVGDLVKGGVRERWREDKPVSLDFSEFGVCDNPQQVVDRFKLKERPEKFFVSLVKIVKTKQPPTGGWRWHKWGPYIGDKNAPTTEYLHDEPDVEEVYTYHIYELN